MRIENCDLKDLPIFKYRNPDGLVDILPDSQRYWHYIEDVLKKISQNFGYRRIMLPPFDAKSLYKTVFGDSSDDHLIPTSIENGDENFVLRAHPRIGLVRSFKENNLSEWPFPIRIFYSSDTYKKVNNAYEQKHRFCLDTIGAKDVTTSANAIFLLHKLAKELKLKSPALVIHSNGCKECKPKFDEAFAKHCKKHIHSLCPHCAHHTTLSEITSCKTDSGSEWLKEGPSILDFLCQSCHDQLTFALETCDQIGVPYDVNANQNISYPEAEQTIISLRIGEEAVPAIVGFHYDGFASLLAEEPLTALGLTIDMQLLSQYLEEQHTSLPTGDGIEVFIAQLGSQAKKRCIPLLQELFSAGYCVVTAGESESITQQLQIAERLRARITLIIGQKEAVNGHVIMRDMSSGLQDDVFMEDLIPTLNDRLMPV